MTQRHYSPRSVAIVLADLLWLVVSLAVAVSLDPTTRRFTAYPEDVAAQATFVLLVYVVTFYYGDLYNFTELRVRRDVVTAAVRVFSVLSLLFGVILLYTEWLTLRSWTILVHLAATSVFVVVVRLRIDALLRRYAVTTRIAIVGTGPEAHGIGQQVLKHPETGHEVAFFVATATTAGGAEAAIQLRVANPGVCSVPVMPPGSIAALVHEHRIKRILVATADVGADLPVEELLQCKADGISIEDGHTFYERMLGRILVADLQPSWLIFSEGFTRSKWALAVKRVVDVVLATALLVATAPLCALVSLAIKLEDGGPVLFGQRRLGRHGVPFTVLKFRSMRVDAEAESGPAWAQADDPRVTRIGRWIRDLRIDEIPQAWNVLRGDMSFVGPRPERPEFIEILRAAIPYYDHRHAMRPGITGWAQVNFPYGATVEDGRHKLEYDLYYLKNFSVVMDVVVIIRTLKILLFGWGSR